MAEVTTIDRAWRDLEFDALASDGRITDADVKNAIKRHRARIEAAAVAASQLADDARLVAQWHDAVDRMPDELRAARDALALLIDAAETLHGSAISERLGLHRPIACDVVGECYVSEALTAARKAKDALGGAG